MTDIKDARVAILATHGFEKSELFKPKDRLQSVGADVTVISPQGGSIKSWDEDDWGESVRVDMVLDEAKVSDFDALILPGGQINPDVLRTDEKAVGFIREYFDSGKTLAAICHAPWLLIEAGVISGRKATSYHSIATDMKNAGALWEDSPVVVDRGLITSRRPGDLDAFCDKIIEKLREGRPKRTAA